MNLELKYKAINLRKNGLSYSEIRAVLGDISKGTMANWFRNISLSDEQYKRLEEKARKAGYEGRIKGSEVNRAKKIDRLRRLKDEASVDFDKLKSNPLFLIGVAFYAAEGSQKTPRFQFSNSNPSIILVMIKWLKEICNIPEESISYRLYIHTVYSGENCEKYWHNLLALPSSKMQKTVFKPTSHTVKKNPLYKGCIKIDIKGSDLYWKTQYWKEMMFIEY